LPVPSFGSGLLDAPAVGTGLGPGSADAHRAPAAIAGRRTIIEGPLAVVGSAGLEPGPGPVGGRRGRDKQQARQGALDPGRRGHCGDGALVVYRQPDREPGGDGLDRGYRAPGRATRPRLVPGITERARPARVARMLAQDAAQRLTQRNGTREICGGDPGRGGEPAPGQPPAESLRRGEVVGGFFDVQRVDEGTDRLKLTRCRAYLELPVGGHCLLGGHPPRSLLSHPLRTAWRDAGVTSYLR